MAQNKVALKRRIRSVRATKKITSAMELIATSKLQRMKHKMEMYRTYANTLFHTFHRVLDNANVLDVPYLSKREGKILTVIFVSDMGLCGGYNSNILHKIKAEIPKDKPVYVHCRSSQRSYNMVRALGQLGYELVYNIDGSFLGLSEYEYFNDVTFNRDPIVTEYNFN